MFSCIQCRNGFQSSNAVLQHCRDEADHNFCRECNLIFPNDTALWRHVRGHSNVNYPDQDQSSESGDSDDGSGPRFTCLCCRATFNSNEKLTRHLKQQHNWCSICDKYFRTASALANHNSSPVHRAKTHLCPLCNKAHKVPSATTHHIESGTCHNITRHQVTAAAHSLDIDPAITAAHRLIAGVQPVPTAIAYYTATEDTFNGQAYQCFLCTKTCQTLTGLNSHLNSAAHDQTEFECPKCKREFKVLSGLIQHIESEVCGIARLQQVENYANDLVAQFSGALTM